MDIQVFQHDWLNRIILIGIILFFAVLLHQVLVRYLKGVSQRMRIPAMISAPLYSVTRILIILLTLSFSLTVIGVPVMTLVTTGLAMVAVGFVAVWSVLSNIACTFLIILTRPFEIGDEVEFLADNCKGKVVDLTLFFTSLKSEDGRTLRVPNNFFFQKAIACQPGTPTVKLEEQLESESPAK